MRRLAALLALGLLATDTAGATTIGRVTLPQMTGSASAVFVGVFESAKRAQLGGRPGLRYRIRVERFMRGGPADTVHLWSPELPGIALGVERGQRYLVFAERRRFGITREERLTPSGYHQGVYRVLDDRRATNVSNGDVDLRRLPGELRREARVRVTLVHQVNRSRSAYIEGAAYVVRFERAGMVVAKEAGYLEDPARLRLRRGWYVVASGAHPCGGPGCGSVDFQNDLGVDSCRRPIRLTGATMTIRVVAQAGRRCRIRTG